jgi:hypothetical protein
MSTQHATGEDLGVLQAEDQAMRLAAQQMTRIAESLPEHSRVRGQMLANARWWHLSAIPEGGET